MINFTNINYEILFVFDDESDPTIPIINQYMSDMNFKILITDTHYPSMARNYGLKQAQGEYIWFVDGDDWLIYPEVVITSLQLLRNKDENLIQIKFVSNFFNMEHYSMVWQYIFKKSFLDDIEFQNILHFEDNDFMQKVLKKNNSDSLIYLNIPCYFYNYRRPGSLTYNLWRGIE